MHTFLRAAILAGGVLSGLTPLHAYDFSSLYFFGDSLTDEGRGGQTAPVMWPTVFRNDTSITTGANLAIGGATTSNQPSSKFGDSSYLGQVNAFASSASPIGGKPGAGIWIGTNNIWLGSSQGVAPATIVANATADVAVGISALANAGVRNILLLGTYDLSLTNAYMLAGSDSLKTRAAAALASQQYNSRLAALNAPGASIQYFDIANFINHLMTHPQTYGFQRILPLAPGQSCDASCQTTSIFADTIHFTSKTQALIGDYIASRNPQYNNLGFTYGAIINNIASSIQTASLTDAYNQSAATNFAKQLFNRLELSRNSPFGALNTAARPEPWSVFAMGDFYRENMARSGPFAGSGPSHYYAKTGATLGVQHQSNQQDRIGAAFNFAHLGSQESKAFKSEPDMDAYQLAFFVSHSGADWFADATMTAGASAFNSLRSGTFGNVSGSTSGSTLSAAGRAGYMINIGPLRLGPVLEATTMRSFIKGYQERGPLIATMAYGARSASSLSASGGVQVRLADPRSIDPYITVSFERVLSSRNPSIPISLALLPTQTLPASAYVGGDSINLATGGSFSLGQGWSGELGAFGQIGSKGQSGYGLNGGATYRF